MKRDCGHCDYFDEGTGQCRRRSPVAVCSKGEIHFCWPDTRPECWCGDWIEKSMVGGPANYVTVSIRDHKTGELAYSEPRLFGATKPGQVTIWDFRTDIILSNDFEIRVDWPLEKIESKVE